MGRIYIGCRKPGGCQVMVGDNGNWQHLMHVVRHSPDGFEWGYGGSGPADLALSILENLVGHDRADLQYQMFKSDVISGLPQQTWAIGEEGIRAWLRAIDTGIKDSRRRARLVDIWTPEVVR